MEAIWERRHEVGATVILSPVGLVTSSASQRPRRRGLDPPLQLDHSVRPMGWQAAGGPRRRPAGIRARAGALIAGDLAHARPNASNATAPRREPCQETDNTLRSHSPVYPQVTDHVN